MKSDDLLAKNKKYRNEYITGLKKIIYPERPQKFGGGGNSWFHKLTSVRRRKN